MSSKAYLIKSLTHSGPPSVPIGRYDGARKTQRDSWQRGADNSNTNNGYRQAFPLPNTSNIGKAKPIPNARPIRGVNGSRV